MILTYLALQRFEKIGGPDTIRTYDLCLRRAALYPAELRVRAAAVISAKPRPAQGGCSGLSPAARGARRRWCRRATATAPGAAPEPERMKHDVSGLGGAP
jgi:hypothetical protein